MTIEITQFPTHIAKTDNKYAPNKMIKINNQSIYNGAVNRFTRATVMKNLHAYLKNELSPYLSSLPVFKYPLKISLDVHTVINHGNISMRKGKICWKPAEEDYEPNWDIENLASIWIKALNDAMTQLGFIKDDNVKFISKVGYEYHQVKDLDERKLIIKINE